MTATAYETTFQGYAEKRPELVKWVRKHYIEEFKLKPERRILDVACGNGFWGGIFAEEGFTVSGFDKHEGYLADGREQWPELDLVYGNVEENFPHSERFSVVFCRTLPHFYAEDLPASLPVMKRLLDATASNGVLLLTFWTDQSRIQKPGTEFWMWSQEDFVRLIEEAGGKLRKLNKVGNYLIMSVTPTDRPSVPFVRLNGTPGEYPQSFGLNGLAQIEEFLNEANAVVPMREAPFSRDVVAMRHDVDHSLSHAMKFARWESERGYRSTYFVLHTAPYYTGSPDFYADLRALQDMGHEIGLHVNAVIQARAGGYSTAAEIILDALTDLRANGLDVVGTAAHGDYRCSEWNLSNLDIWAAGYTPQDFGLEYEAYHRHQAASYISDNGGRWIGEENELLLRPHFHKSLATHLLVHPIHWPVNE